MSAHDAGKRAKSGAAARRLRDAGAPASVCEGPVPSPSLPRPSRELVPGGGRPLPEATNAEYSQRFGEDFSAVRVHDDGAARARADSLQARAFTVGDRIVLGDVGALDGDGGRRTLAHELAHVVQQRRGGATPALSRDGAHEQGADRAASAVMSGATSVSVSGATGVGVARQAKPDATVLTPEQMLTEVLKQRGFTNRAPQPMPAEGPNAAKEAGAMRGPRLGNGRDTHSFIQVLDKDGKVVAHELGAHLAASDDVEAAARRDVPRAPGEKGKVHAERMSMGALDRRLNGVDVTGGKMQVVVDQLPCGPGEKNCMGGLQEFARKKGLKLEVYVPTRDSATTPGKSVTPKTASRTAFRGPEVADPAPNGSAKLKQIYPLDAGGDGGGPTGAKPATSSASTPAKPATSTPATSASTSSAPSTPKPATPFKPKLPTPKPMSAEAAKLVTRIDTQTRAATRLNARISGYMRVFGGLMQAVGYVDTYADAMKMFSQGTVLGDQQRQANAVEARAAEALTEAEERWEEVSILEWMNMAEKAMNARNQAELDAITDALDDYARKLDDPVEQLGEAAKDLSGRAQALRKFSDLFMDAAKIPQGFSTASNAQQFAMSESLSKLAGTVNSAAEKFSQAEAYLRALRDAADNVSSQTHSVSWDITFERFIEVQRQYDAEEARRKAAAPPPVKKPFNPADYSHKPDDGRPARAAAPRGAGGDSRCPKARCHTASPPPGRDLLDGYAPPPMNSRLLQLNQFTDSDAEAMRRWIEGSK